MPNKGMGKGLAALLGEHAPGDELREIPVEMVSPNPDQPRQHFDAAELEALTKSIAECGVIQPILVQSNQDGSYQLIAGERRWRAASKAGLTRVPAVVRSSRAEQADRLELALIENVARQDLGPIEEATACARLVDEVGLSHEEVGRRVGRSRVSISNLLRLLELPDEVQKLLSEGRLSKGHARALLQEKDQRRRASLARQVSTRGLSVRQAEALAKKAGRSQATESTPAAVSLHPDLEQSRRDIEDSLSSALGVEVSLRVSGDRAKAEIHFSSLSEARQFAERFDARVARAA